MNNKQRVQIALLGLVVLNLLTIGFVGFQQVGKKKGHPPFKGPRNIIIERLGLDDKQVEAYDKLIEQHRKQVNQLDKKIGEVRKQLYMNLGNSAIELDHERLQQVADLHAALERVNYKHFSDIKSICKEEQLSKYEELTRDLARLFRRKRPR